MSDVKFKDNQYIAPEFDIEAGTAIFHFNPKWGKLEPLHFTLEKTHPANQRRAALAGFAQVRIIDAAAIKRDRGDGTLLSNEEMLAAKHEAVAEMIAHLESGTDQWNVRRSAGPREEGSLIIRAVAAVQGVAVEVMRERVTAMAEKRGITLKAYLNQLATLEAVGREMARLRGGSAEVAQGMLDELGEE